MAIKIEVSKFVEFLNNRCLAKDGYIMGATGQDPKKWAITSWWYAQYTDSQKEKAMYWRSHAKRVWDCNGLAEGFYKDVTGIDINTKARYNYSGWCSVKGAGKVPNKHKVPGLAVFMGETAKTITHVGYLVAPVDKSKPEGDWYVIEARGVMYGVVKTRLNARDWNYWGYMDRYFDYSQHDIEDGIDDTVDFGDRTLRKGNTGEDVKELQRRLMRAGQKLPKYKDDGDFGNETLDAVTKFQKANNLTVDGIVGKQTFAALEKYEETPTSSNSKVVVTGGSVNVRSTNNTSGDIILVAHKDDKYDLITTKGNWHNIKTEKGNGWISGKYSKVVEE